ncbi:FlgO family outer membrane protein [Endozoicomonas lisbonensis]|uniref:TolB-like protein n=1 Tax=Endozoicomonas lisbonensis TaxID=3120522 RepID=A0ABV2SNX8_9GAMM
MKALLSPLLLTGALMLLAACKTQTVYNEPEPIDLVAVTTGASKALAKKVKNSLSADAIILSTSLANIDDLNSTSTLGRVISEQLASGLMQSGYRLKEIKMRSNVFISEEKAGEFTLSRRLAVLSKSHDAGAILTGTYAVASKTVYVNARLIDTGNSLVLASVDFQLPLDADMRTMTRKDQFISRSIPKKTTPVITRTFKSTDYSEKNRSE